MDAMEVKIEPKLVQPCSYQKKRFTKWKPRKCFSGGGQKSLLKWKRDSTQASRKYRQQGLCQAGKHRHGNRRLFIDNNGDCKNLRPGSGRTFPGMQAPRNTTQYLMHLVYQDLVNDSVKGQDSEFESVYSRVASDFDDSQYMGPELLYYETASSQSTCSQSNIDLEKTRDILRCDFENIFNVSWVENI